ncbi:NYN domain-containing protein [Peptoniphilus sp. oral taxon 386]|uniref:NYN domain-containing protein n=1 Tax=Peptoniphilus sp. oral taxon 386 TaxID=652713 RepID=UPI0001DA9AB2|nr:NYN domain-containing protein [Peptoniphilus sp. oral taxon 386]EFI41996.1 hypothetical protein HMPREF0629_00628 [Peptoniphilus sp. oral taxon 386 str. F0131]
MKPIRYLKNYEYLFVDGYNIINSWEVFKNYREDLEEQRKRLIDILSEYSHVIQEKIILVFDGYMVKKSPGAIYEHDNILVVFTRELETADHFIERQLDEMGRVRKIRVATSDNIEQQIILSRGGIRISAREFEVEVENGMKKINKNIVTLKKNYKNELLLDAEVIRKLNKIRGSIKE